MDALSAGRRQHGFSLVEVLLVMVISTIVLGATVTTYAKFVRSHKTNDRRNESAEMARRALDVEARQLRNLAQRISDPVIDTVGDYDFVFQTSDPTRTWVRYCLDVSQGADRGRLWEQAGQPGAVGTAVPDGAVSTCPGPVTKAPAPGTFAWTTKRLVATHVVNRSGGRDRPVFSYSCSNPAVACTGAAATFDQITGVGSQVFVDIDPTRAPPEDRVATSVFLRNQNQAPVAKFSVTTVKARTVLLNASESADAEGRTLAFYWFKNSFPPTAKVNCAQPTSGVSSSGVITQWGGTLIGTGLTLQHTFAEASNTTQSIQLIACDPGNRFAVAGPTGVKVP